MHVREAIAPYGAILSEFNRMRKRENGTKEPKDAYTGRGTYGIITAA